MTEEYKGLYNQESLEFLRDVVGPTQAQKEKEEFAEAVIAILLNFRVLKKSFVTAPIGTTRAEMQEYMFIQQYLMAQAHIFGNEFSEHYIKNFGLDKIGEAFKGVKGD